MKNYNSMLFRGVGLLKNVGIFLSSNKDCNSKVIDNVIDIFLNFGVQIYVDCKKLNYSKKIIVLKDVNSVMKNIELAVVFGGDGSIIHYAKKASEYGVPILGINMGRIGFLSSMEKDEAKKIYDVVNEKFIVSSRVLLEVICKDRRMIALNEVALNRTPESSIPRYEIYKGKNKIYECYSDGIIVSTPTGSTAYSMSAGGPVVQNDLDCLVITPVCPYTNFLHSIVLDTKDEIEAKFYLRNGGVSISIDGKSEFIFNNDESIKIKKSSLYTKFVVLKEDNFYKNINKKITNKFC